MPADLTRGLPDTNTVILRRTLDADELPDEVAISAVTLAELSAGVHLVIGEEQQAVVERARRADVLARVENEFDPIPFETEAARAFGRICAAEPICGRHGRYRASSPSAVDDTSVGLGLFWPAAVGEAAVARIFRSRSVVALCFWI